MNEKELFDIEYTKKVSGDKWKVAHMFVAADSIAAALKTFGYKKEASDAQPHVITNRGPCYIA